MPLYVTNGKLQLGEPGKLAAQRACCCNEEGNDPGDCVCPDFCLYDIAITSPVSLGLGPLNCDSPDDISRSEYFETSGSGGANWDIIDCANCSGTGFLSGQLTRSLSSINFFLPLVPWGLFTIGVGARAFASSCRLPCPIDFDYPCTGGRPHIKGDEYVPAQGQASATVAVYCIDNKFYLTAYWTTDGSTGGDVRGYYNLVRSATFSLSSECKVQPANKSCGELVAFLASEIQSLTISVDESGTSLGPWQAEYLTKIPEQAEGPVEGAGCTPTRQGFLDASLAQTIAEQGAGFSASFSITRRPSCRVVPCNCSTSINGLTATFEGKEFTLGTPDTIEEGNTRWQHEIDGGGSYNFYKDTFLPENVDCGIGSFSVPVELITLSLYCATDSTADPPVPRWMVEATTVCAPTNVVDCGLVATGFSQRLFNGHIRCYEGLSECAGPPGGAYIPMGSPIDIVEADGSPFLNPDLPDCGASNFPSFRLEQNCSA